MLHSLTYPAFLTGRPARHREYKQCLVALQVEVDVPEALGYQAPVVMGYNPPNRRAYVELRGFEGQLYRSLDLGAEGLGRYTESQALDTKSEILGCLADIAMRDYFRMRDNYWEAIPRNIAMSQGRLLLSSEDTKRIFHIGREFAVEEDDQDRAKELEDKARERFGRFLVIDGKVWTQAVELTYRAIPAGRYPTGRVHIESGGYLHSPDDPGQVKRYPAWSDPEARFFNALSPDEAAEYAGISADGFPRIDVIDTSFVRSDFEAIDLDRCARNVVDEIGDRLTDFPQLRELRNLVAGFIRPDRPLGRSPDKLADLLAKVADEARRTDVQGKVLKRFTPDRINGFIDRWNSRPIELSAIGTPAFTY